MAAAIQVTAKLNPADAAALQQAKTVARGLKQEALTELKRTAKPISTAMIQEVAPELPRRGGLAYRVAGATAIVTARLAAGGAEVALNFRKPRVLGAIERGSIPHPVFGRADRPRGQWPWVTQPIEPGKVTAAFQRNVRTADAAMTRALTTFERKLGFK